ncbi:DivIVA domain-containing protein [Nakamurella flava]|uniref:Cell wall synthesis protein Wag31 n=1 Tax=Nakamurella flava TaxID=2576308 RepID=A0A4U6QII3_9ACTN|nr:DivIVA domain-containing protein [Nakamurella flava]TKV60207.1 DivIVA domain-containing protein [Nakamurella flava]
MALTPADVHNVEFKKPSLGKRGYDEDEVDVFLDKVEAELGRLIEENNELQGKVAEYERGGTPAKLTKDAAAAPAPTTTGEAHTQAARLLGLAQETADKLTSEARAEADRVLTDAQSQSEQLMADAKSQSDALVTDATTRAEATERDSKIRADKLDADAQAKYQEVIGSLNAEKTRLNDSIQSLREYEQQYRGSLKSWIGEQLQQLENTPPREPQPAAASAK